MSIKRICAWCKRPMGPVSEEASTAYPVTHGMCDECRDMVLGAAREYAQNGKMRRSLQRIPQPMIAMSDRIEVIESTREAQVLLGSDAESLVGQRPGDIIRCVNAQDAECGTTPECPACNLRRTLTTTIRDGVAASHVEAERQVIIDGEPVDVTFEFSTERVGKVGLMVLHRVSKPPISES